MKYEKASRTWLKADPDCMNAPSCILPPKYNGAMAKIRKVHREAPVSPGEQPDPLLPGHQTKPILHDGAEAREQFLLFGRLSAQQGYRFGILTQSYESKTEIRLAALLLEIERDQGSADPMRDRSAQHGINQRRPHQIAGIT